MSFPKTITCIYIPENLNEFINEIEWSSHQGNEIQQLLRVDENTEIQTHIIGNPAVKKVVSNEEDWCFYICHPKKDANTTLNKRAKLWTRMNVYGNAIIYANKLLHFDFRAPREQNEMAFGIHDFKRITDTQILKQMNIADAQLRRSRRLSGLPPLYRIRRRGHS